jgi:hypothetical protein
MSKIKLVQKKGKLDRYCYKNLTEEELNINPKDLVNQADAEQTKEFEFVAWEQELTDKVAHCRDGLNNRYFYEDSIKKSKRSIKNDKILTRKIRKHGKAKSNRKKIG